MCRKIFTTRSHCRSQREAGGPPTSFSLQRRPAAACCRCAAPSPLIPHVRACAPQRLYHAFAHVANVCSACYASRRRPTSARCRCATPSASGLPCTHAHATAPPPRIRPYTERPRAAPVTLRGGDPCLRDAAARPLPSGQPSSRCLARSRARRPACQKASPGAPSSPCAPTGRVWVGVCVPGGAKVGIPDGIAWRQW